MKRVASLAAGALLVLLGLGCTPMLARAPGAAIASRPDCPYPSFDGDREIEEAGSMQESADRCWWLSSGGIFRIERGVGRTLQGTLDPGSRWHSLYEKSSPADTDDGDHPQNLLRLVTRALWRDYRQEVRFRINRVNLSASEQRGEWSGILLFGRYLDQNNLYYAGLRMDGTAVIKKKFGGKYVTLAQRPVFGQPQAYDRATNPSLLPAGRWIGLASVIKTQPDGSVRITLATRDEQGAGGWQVAAEAVDDGRQEGAPIVAAGHGGLRADFMDVEFSGYAATNGGSL